MVKDVTATYEQARARSVATAAGAAERISGSTVLLVRGFLSDAIVQIGALIESIPDGRQVAGGIGEYFDAQMRWLGRIHAPCERVRIESEAPVRDNAARIRGRIEAFPRVLIISHSKGCLDVLEALLGAPALWSRLAGWIAIQGPFAGTPVADAIAAQPALRIGAAAVLAAAGGSIASIEDMRTTTREASLDHHAARISDLLAAVPTLCFASHMPPKRCAPILAPTAALIEATPGGGHNDGLVPRASAVLPGARVVFSHEVDHAMPVMASLEPLDRVAFTQALLCTL
jgi:hypothetical protein